LISCSSGTSESSIKSVNEIKNELKETEPTDWTDFLDFPEKYTGQTFEWHVEYNANAIKTLLAKDITDITFHTQNRKPWSKVKVSIPKNASIPNIQYGEDCVLKFVFNGKMAEGNEFISLKRLGETSDWVDFLDNTEKYIGQTFEWHVALSGTAIKTQLAHRPTGGVKNVTFDTKGKTPRVRFEVTIPENAAVPGLQYGEECVVKFVFNGQWHTGNEFISLKRAPK